MDGLHQQLQQGTEDQGDGDQKPVLGRARQGLSRGGRLGGRANGRDAERRDAHRAARA